VSDSAVWRERQFVSTQAERIEGAARHLREATFYTPGEDRSAIVADVVARLERVAEELRSRI
jgi:hypothetical protein